MRNIKFHSLQLLFVCLVCIPASYCAVTTADNPSVMKSLRLVAEVKSFKTGSLAFSPESKLLANGYPGKIMIWDARKWKLLRTLQNPKITSPFAFSPDAKTISVCTMDGRVQVWDVRTGKLRKTLVGQRMDVAFSPDGSLMAGSSAINSDAEKRVKIWDSQTGRIIQLLAITPTDRDQYAFSLNNNSLIVASVDEYMKMYNVKTGQLISEKEAHGDISPPIVLSPDGKVIATILEGDVVGDDPAPDGDIRPATDSGLPSSYSLRLWNARKGKLIRDLGYWETKYAPSSIIGFTADGKKLIVNIGEAVAYSGDIHARLYDVATGKALRTIDIENPVLLSPDGKLLVGGKENLKVWAMP